MRSQIARPNQTVDSEETLASDRYIKYASSTIFIHLTLACSLYFLHITNVVEQRDESEK